MQPCFWQRDGEALPGGIPNAGIKSHALSHLVEPVENEFVIPRIVWPRPLRLSQNCQQVLEKKNVPLGNTQRQQRF